MKAILIALIPFAIGSFLLACNQTSLQDSGRLVVSMKAEASSPAPTADDDESINIPLPVTGG